MCDKDPAFTKPPTTGGVKGFWQNGRRRYCNFHFNHTQWCTMDQKVFLSPNSHWKRSSCKMVNTTITFGKSARVTWLNCFILFMCVGSQQEVNQSTEKRKKNSRIMGNIVFIVSCNLTHFRHWDISACQTWQWHLEKELRAVSSQIDPYVCPE